ncbi:MAG: hypothetical protein ACPGID_01560 [Rubricella sp.]
MLFVGCTPLQPAAERGGAIADPRLHVANAGTTLISEGPGDIAEITARATRLDREDLIDRPGTERIGARQVPYLVSAAYGRSFLLADAPKALVRGYPEAQCPVRAQIRVEGAGATPADAIAAALRTCHADLATAGLEEDCGCRVLAHDGFLRAPLADFAYALDMPARLFVDGALDSTRYLARERFGGGSERQLLIFSQIGPVMEIDIDGADASGALVDGRRVSGEREVTGISRGRDIEALTLATSDGTTYRVLIGP